MDASDLASLQTLNALLQERSVTGAAQRLGLSTPAVSHALARLRERFDDELLVRAGRGMVLSPRAEGLKPKVQDALTLSARVFEPPEDFDPGRLVRSFTLSVTDYVLAVLGGTFEAALRSAAPGIALRFLPNATDDPGRLREGTSDLAVGIYGDLPPELRTRPVITDRLVCAVRQDHPRLGRGRLTLARFVELEHVQVAPRGRPGGAVDHLLAEQGLKRSVLRAVPFFHTALELAASSDYVVTAPERLLRLKGSGLGLRILEPPLPLEPYALSMVWHPRYDGDPAHRFLRDQLLEASRASNAMSHPNPRRRLGRRSRS